MKTRCSWLVWLAFVAATGPSFWSAQWEVVLIVFAAVVLAPLALDLLGRPAGWEALALSTLLAFGYYFFPHPAGAWLAIPYVGWIAWRTMEAARHATWRLADLCRLAALAYWLVGALWALAFLLNYAPLDFDATITSLTSAHFHVAGLVLTTVIFCVLEYQAGGVMARALGMAALAGMPLVAAGIVATHFGYPPVWETLAAGGFAGLALAIAVLHGWFFTQKEHFSLVARRWWLLGGLSLFAGATLAGLYALRVYVPVEGITIPNMKIWHGTLNTLGFGWCVLQGWRRQEGFMR